MLPWKNKRIAILTPTFSAYSGIDRVVESQALELKKQGNNVTVLALEASLKVPGVRVIAVGLPSSATAARVYRLILPKLPKAKKILQLLKGMDVVICHFYPMTEIGSWAKKKYGCEFVYWDHGINETSEGSFIERKYMRWFSRAAYQSIKNADRIFSVSKFLRDELKKKIGKSSTVVYNKIDTSRFNKNVKGTAARKRLRIGNKPMLLYVGRIAPHKGIHTLFKIHKILQKEIPDVTLIIVGKPTFSTYYAAVKKLAGKNVKFVGEIPDEELPKLYAASNVYVTASEWEGFDLPAAEAQSCGKPVVAFSIGSHPEIVKKGTLVKKGDIRGFAKAIERWL